MNIKTIKQTTNEKRRASVERMINLLDEYSERLKGKIKDKKGSIRTFDIAGDVGNVSNVLNQYFRDMIAADEREISLVDFLLEEKGVK